jgi:hypothetical protein
MPNIIRVKLDLTKVLQEHLFHGKNGAKYLDVALLPVRESKYGETHVALQDLPRELRDKGQKGPILGNATERTSEGYQQDAAPARKPRNEPSERQKANLDDTVGDVAF